MPQITLEYTPNIAAINFQAYFKEVNAAVAETLKADIMKCKARARCCETYCVGEGDPDNGFIYIDLLILEGRSMDMQIACAQAVSALTSKYYATVLEDTKKQLTLRIHEMDKPRYFEFVR